MKTPWPPQYAKQPGEPKRVQPSRAKKPVKQAARTPARKRR
jgi:bifunctional non-homologous end joining protein LigD